MAEGVYDADDWDPLAHPGHYLSRISRGLTRVGDARLRAAGLATAQLPVLSMLRDGRQLPQAELARLAKVEQPSMAQLLARMERDGLIRRVPNPDDRRSSLISLTEDAEQRLPAGREVLRQGNADMTRGLSRGEISWSGCCGAYWPTSRRWKGSLSRLCADLVEKLGRRASGVIRRSDVG